MKNPQTGRYETVESGGKRCGCPALLDIEGTPGSYTVIRGSAFGLDYPVCDLVTGPDFGCVHHELPAHND